MLLNQEFLKIDLLAKQIMAGFITGMHSSPFQGFSVEFAEHRMYNPGDNLRHVDWKLLARTEKMFTKKYEEETNLRCQIIIDVSSSMLYPEPAPENKILQSPNKLQFSLLCAAIIFNILKKQRDAAGLTLFDKHIVFHKSPTLSAPGLSLIWNTMNDFLFYDKKNHTTEIAPNLEEISFRIPNRSMVIIFSDTWEKNIRHWNNTLSQFKHKRAELIFFHVFQQAQEAEFNFDFRPIEVTDLETGDKLKIQPKIIKDAYQKNFHQRMDEMKNIFSRFGFDYVEAPVENGYKHVLQTYLQKRKFTKL